MAKLRVVKRNDFDTEWYFVQRLTFGFWWRTIAYTGHASEVDYIVRRAQHVPTETVIAEYGT